MPNLARHSYNVAVVAGTVVIALLNLTIQYLDSLKSLAPWLVALLSAGIIGGLYKLMLSLYERGLWKKIGRKPVLAGKWKHNLLPTDPEPNNDRKGEFEVIQSAFEIKIINGKNVDQKTGLCSFWHSLAIFDDELAEKCLWVIYQIDRSHGQTDQRQGHIDRGLLKLHLTVDKAGRATKMSGNYWDAGWSQHQGQFEAQLVEP
jgi:SMODS-associating 2TM, beta-strand rich effector domain